MLRKELKTEYNDLYTPDIDIIFPTRKGVAVNYTPVQEQRAS